MNSKVDQGQGGGTVLADPVDVVSLWELAESGAAVPDTLVYQSEEDYAWMAESLCIGNEELFFPEREDPWAVKGAKALCAKCPVRQNCLDEVLTYDPTPFGVWAGTTTRERGRLYGKRVLQFNGYGEAKTDV